MEAICVKNLQITLPDEENPLFSDVNLTVNRGEAVALVGLSGSGKSLIAKSIAGIIPHLIKLDIKGDIEIFGKTELSEIEKIQNIGYIFQNPDNQIFSTIVEMELAFGPENLCLPVDEIEKRISKVLKDVNMEEYRLKNPANLSGGQKQLIAIASILTLEPQILICDEILSQLDKDSCELVVSILKKLKAQGKTIFMIEHDLNKIDFLDKIYLLKDKKVSIYEGEI